MDVRKAIESMYKGVCTIIEFKGIKDPITKITTHNEVVVLENQPCRLSYKTVTSTTQTTIPIETQTIKLFIAPDVVIKPGSKLVVTQNGKSMEFSRSGEPAVYTNHQEVMLELFKENT